MAIYKYEKPSITFNSPNVWMEAEPILIDFEVLIAPEPRKIPGKSSRKKAAIFEGDRDKIKDRAITLIDAGTFSLKDIARKCGISLSTVYRISRELKQLRSKESDSSMLQSLSSQAPFGWNIKNSLLQENANELFWIFFMQKANLEGASLRAIARRLDDLKVPTKNGGKWHAKTVSQVLRFHLREDVRRKLSTTRFLQGSDSMAPPIVCELTKLLKQAAIKI